MGTTNPICWTARPVRCCGRSPADHGSWTRSSDGQYVIDSYSTVQEPPSRCCGRRRTGSPIVEQIYTGPHGFLTPKTFDAYRSLSQAISELGFIGFMVDGLGTAGRGREFQRTSFRNLGDSGFEDHMAAVGQLATER